MSRHTHSQIKHFMKVKYFVSTSFLRTSCFLACLSCTSSFAHDLHVQYANHVQIMCNIISGQKRFDGVPAKSAAELSVKGASHWGTKILRGQSPFEKWDSAVLGGRRPAEGHPVVLRGCAGFCGVLRGFAGFCGVP